MEPYGLGWDGIHSSLKAFQMTALSVSVSVCLFTFMIKWATLDLFYQAVRSFRNNTGLVHFNKYLNLKVKTSPTIKQNPIEIENIRTYLNYCNLTVKKCQPG